VRIVPKNRNSVLTESPGKDHPHHPDRSIPIWIRGVSAWRGQLGISRRLANPVPIVVTAALPDGSTGYSRVVASTGEFTADFSVPQGMGPAIRVFQATYRFPWKWLGNSLPSHTGLPWWIHERGFLRPFDSERSFSSRHALSGRKGSVGENISAETVREVVEALRAQEVQDSSPVTPVTAGDLIIPIQISTRLVRSCNTDRPRDTCWFISSGRG